MTDRVRNCRKCGQLFSGVRCMPCYHAYNSAYREKNKDKANARSATFYLRNKQKVIDATNARRRADPDKTRALENARNNGAYKERKAELSSAYKLAHPKAASIATLKWLAANPHYSKERRQQRRALIGDGKLSKGLVKKLLKLQRGKCACCGEPLGKNFDLDHIIPLARGGLNIDSNMQLLTARCNRQKGAKHPIDFMQSRGFLL